MKISRLSSLAVITTALSLTLPVPAGARTPPQDPTGATIAGSYLAARLAGQERDSSAAATYLRDLLKLDSDNPEVVERTFIASLMDGDMDSAVDLARRLVEIKANHPIARLTLGVNALRKKQYRTARSNLAQAVQIPFGELTATLLGGWSFFGSGEPKSAITVIDQLRGPEWYEPFKVLNSGLILDAAGKSKDAGALLRQAAELEPTSVNAVDAYARWLSRNDSPKGAIAFLDKLDKPIQNHLLVKALRTKLEAGKPLPAVISTPQQGAAEVLYDLGALLAPQGGEDLAIVYLRLAIWLDPEHPFNTWLLADIYAQLKQPEMAIRLYEKVPASSPVKWQADVQRAINLDQAGKFSEALDSLKVLSKEKPDDPDTIIALGQIQQTHEMFAECADSFGRAIALIPEQGRRNWLLHFRNGICNERAKNWPVAEASLKKALEFSPDNPDILNYLGYSWVDQGVNLDEGLDMIRKAVALRPDDGPITDSLGWAYYRLGRYDDAVSELERAVELMPQDSTINDHLGDAYWKTGRKLEAGFQWNHARDLDPKPDDLARIKEKIRLGLDAVEKPVGQKTDKKAEVTDTQKEAAETTGQNVAR